MGDTDSSFSLEEMKSPRKSLKRKRSAIEKEEINEMNEEDPDSPLRERKWMKNMSKMENYDKLPRSTKELERLLIRVKEKIKEYRNLFFSEEEELKGKTNELVKKSKVSENSIPVTCDVRSFDWDVILNKKAFS